MRLPSKCTTNCRNFNVITGKLLLAGSNGNSRRLRNFDSRRFRAAHGPHLRAPHADRRTVLRTGFGVSYVEAGKGGGQLYKNPCPSTFRS